MGAKTAFLSAFVLACLCVSGFALTLDGFESYADTAAMQAAWQILPATQPAVSTALSTTEFHTGAKSLRYNYDCGTSPYYSVIINVFPSDQDLSAYNILNFWLKGVSAATNSSEHVEIYLYRLAGATYNDPNDLELIGSTRLSGIMQNDTWQEHQANIQVGFGDRSAVRAVGIGIMPKYYGDGELWFDDLEFRSASWDQLEDFESYADNTELLAFGTNDGNGGGWRTTTPPNTLSLSTTEVHGGLQSMRFDYDNSADPYWSKAMRWLEWTGYGQDWRAYDYLVINFKVTDRSGYLQCAIIDGWGGTQETINYDGTNVTPEGDWVRWEIDLNAIEDRNSKIWMVGRVDLHIRESANTDYGAGTVYFDDIHLNVCVEDVPGDISGNCRVNAEDLNLLATNWMDAGCEADTWCVGCDLDQSTDVDLADFAMLVGNWLECNLLVQTDCD